MKLVFEADIDLSQGVTVLPEVMQAQIEKDMKVKCFVVKAENVPWPVTATLTNIKVNVK